MRNPTGRRRPVRVLGAFLVAVLAASGALLAVGTDIASADTANWAVVGNPPPIRQNTQGNATYANGDLVDSSGTTAAFEFDVPTWKAGTSLDITVAPNDAGHPGLQCATTPQPMGVNQSTPQAGNYVGFAQPRRGLENGTGNVVFPPIVDSVGVPPGPQFTITYHNEIPCSSADPLGDGLPNSVADPSFATLRLTFQNSGANGHVFLGQGVAQDPLPEEPADPAGCGLRRRARPGPLLPERQRHGCGRGPLPSAATVVGQDPIANDPPSSLQRNSASDAVSGPISEFMIVENVANALPPTDGTPPNNPMGPNQFLVGNNQSVHNLRASASGAVCLVIDNGQGNDLRLGLPGNGWSVTPTPALQASRRLPVRQRWTTTATRCSCR